MAILPAPKSMNEQFKGHKIFVVYSLADKCFYWTVTYNVRPLTFTGTASDIQAAMNAARAKIDELEGTPRGRKR